MSPTLRTASAIVIALAAIITLYDAWERYRG